MADNGSGFTFTHAEYLIATGALDLSADDKWLMILDTTTSLISPGTADYGADNIDDIVTLGEWDPAGYTAGGKQIVSPVVTEVNPTLVGGYVRLDDNGSNLTWTLTGNPTNDIAGFLLYVEAGSAGQDIPIRYFPASAGMTQPVNGDTFTIVFHTQGILNVKTG